VNEALALKKARKEAKKTARDVAEYLGVTEDMIRRYESGRSEITLSQAGKYAEFLGKQLGDIFESTTVRAADLQQVLVALEQLTAEERPQAIEHAARTIAYTARMMNGRVARVTDTNTE
jgi:transcriptional regulator with XRE-family HTH domain